MAARDKLGHDPAMDWEIEARAHVEGTTVTIASHRPAPPLARRHAADDLVIGLFPSAAPRTSVGSLSGAAGLGFRPIGRLMVIPPGRTLEVRTRGEAQRRMIWCHIAPTTLDLSWPEDQAALAGLLDLRSPAIARLLRELAGEAASPGIASAVKISALSMLILVELARHLQRRTRAKGGLAPWQLRRLHALLADYRDPPATAALAAACGLSERQLMRGFRQSTGATIGEYVREARLRAALRLLGETRRPIGEIARALGFASTASFSATVKRATGASPKQHRRLPPNTTSPRA